jgi:hypothetical protein
VAACEGCSDIPANTRRDAMVAAVVRSMPAATISLTPPPVDAREPETAPATDGRGKSVFLLASVVAALVAVVVVLGWGQITGRTADDDRPNQAVANGPSSQTPATTDAVTTSAAPAVVPCPDAVTRWFPESTANAALVALYDTDGYVVTVCRGGSGQLYYDGQQKDVAASSTTHIFLPAQETSTGFTAVNVDYRYRIDGPDLTLTHNGEVVRHWILSRVG